MTDGRSRRALLSVWGLILAGCSGQADPDNDSTVTPAAVPTTAPRPTVGPTGPQECPELPSNAEVYVCSPRAGPTNSFRLVPSPPTYEGTDALSFTFLNSTEFTFRTGPDWWTLAADTGSTWTTVTQGPGEGRLTVPPGRTAVWRVRPVATESAARQHATLQPGAYAFVVTGYAAGGELTAVVAPFRVAPIATDRDGAIGVSLTRPSTRPPSPAHPGSTPDGP